MKFTIILFIIIHCASSKLVINTWNFVSAADSAWQVLNSGGSAIDSLVAGCGKCEELQCDGTVGYGGSPNEKGLTALDAMIMDGNTMNVGAVASMQNIRNAIGVAKMVLEHTKHSFLVGQDATDFAVEMGFTEQPTATEHSEQLWDEWKNRNCQPNFWTNVSPDPSTSCGPYTPITENDVNFDWKTREGLNFGRMNHDTIGMIVIDSDNNKIVAGTSTNGASFKIPGRVGDSAIIGSGAYADASIGAAAATGDGDVMMRFLPSFLAVEQMRRGSTPKAAADIAIERIARVYPTFVGAIVVADKNARFAASCYGIEEFPYSVANSTTSGAILLKEKCLTL